MNFSGSSIRHRAVVSTQMYRLSFVGVETRRLDRFALRLPELRDHHLLRLVDRVHRRRQDHDHYDHHTDCRRA